MLTFSQLLRETADSYREQPRVFHVLACRYWLGKESLGELESHTQVREVAPRSHMKPELTIEQVKIIISRTIANFHRNCTDVEAAKARESRQRQNSPIGGRTSDLD